VLFAALSRRLSAISASNLLLFVVDLRISTMLLDQRPPPATSTPPAVNNNIF
jgi:hypothetical protein